MLTNLIVTGTGDTIADDGVMTLREAITAANSMPGKDTVSFSTPTDDPRHLYYLDDGAAGRVSRFDANSASLLATTTVADDANLPKTGSLAVDPDWMHSFYSIQLSSALPAITDAVVIDGYTQTGSSANSNPITLPANTVLRVELTSVAGNDFDGLDITGGGSAIRGIAIHGFGFHAADGILLASAGNTVEGSHIGADVSGLTGSGNQGYGVFVNNAANNIIGGTAAAARNLFSGNRDGVHISGEGSTGNLVQGNVMPSQVNGSGVAITAGASQNTVGGTIPSARNVISQSQYGVTISGDGIAANPHDNFVQGNFIGTDITGTLWLPNNTGILIGSPNTVVGGLTATPGTGPGNVVVSALYSVFITGQDTTGVRVEGNLIGTNATGTAVPDPWGQYYTGVLVSGGGGNIVGGPDPQARNVISGTANRGGVVLQEGGSLVQNNLIGTDITGTVDLGNHGGGIQVQSSDNTIRDNVIAFTKILIEEGGEPFGSGVIVMSGTGNSILSNSIFASDLLGIELLHADTPDGLPLPNDTMDPDTGPNNLQNFPVITSVSSSGGSTTITGTFNSTPDESRYRLEFFSGGAADPSGFGEGESFLGFALVDTDDSNGNATFSFTLPVAVSAEQFVTATATDSTGNTSEFSAPVTMAVETAPDLVISLSADISVPIGQDVTYSVGISNIGTATATGLTLSDPVPAGASFVSATLDSTVVNGVLTFTNLGNLAPGDSIDLNIVLRPSIAGTLTNSVTVTEAETDPTPDNNTFTLGTRVIGPSLDGTLTGTAPDTVTLGQDVTYTLTATYTGSESDVGGSLTDTLPTNATFVSATGNPTLTNGVLTFTLGGSLNSPDAFSFTIVVHPTVAGSLLNAATVHFRSEERRVGKECLE